MPRGAAIAGRTPLAYPILVRLEEFGLSEDGLDAGPLEPGDGNSHPEHVVVHRSGSGIAVAGGSRR